MSPVRGLKRMSYEPIAASPNDITITRSQQPSYGACQDGDVESPPLVAPPHTSVNTTTSLRSASQASSRRNNPWSRLVLRSTVVAMLVVALVVGLSSSSSSSSARKPRQVGFTAWEARAEGPGQLSTTTTVTTGSEQQDKPQTRSPSMGEPTAEAGCEDKNMDESSEEETEPKTMTPSASASSQENLGPASEMVLKHHHRHRCHKHHHDHGGHDHKKKGRHEHDRHEKVSHGDTEETKEEEAVHVGEADGRPGNDANYHWGTDWYDWTRWYSPGRAAEGVGNQPGGGHETTEGSGWHKSHAGRVDVIDPSDQQEKHRPQGGRPGASGSTTGGVRNGGTGSAKPQPGLRTKEQAAEEKRAQGGEATFLGGRGEVNEEDEYKGEVNEEDQYSGERNEEDVNPEINEEDRYEGEVNEEDRKASLVVIGQEQQPQQHPQGAGGGAGTSPPAQARKQGTPEEGGETTSAPGEHGEVNEQDLSPDVHGAGHESDEKASAALRGSGGLAEQQQQEEEPERQGSGGVDTLPAPKKPEAGGEGRTQAQEGKLEDGGEEAAVGVVESPRTPPVAKGGGQSGGQQSQQPAQHQQQEESTQQQEQPQQVVPHQQPAQEKPDTGLGDAQRQSDAEERAGATSEERGGL